MNPHTRFFLRSEPFLLYAGLTNCISGDIIKKVNMEAMENDRFRVVQKSGRSDEK